MLGWSRFGLTQAVRYELLQGRARRLVTGIFIGATLAAFLMWFAWWMEVHRREREVRIISKVACIVRAPEADIPIFHPGHRYHLELACWSSKEPKVENRQWRVVR